MKRRRAEFGALTFSTLETLNSDLTTETKVEHEALKPGKMQGAIQKPENHDEKFSSWLSA